VGGGLKLALGKTRQEQTEGGAALTLDVATAPFDLPLGLAAKRALKQGAAELGEEGAQAAKAAKVGVKGKEAGVAVGETGRPSLGVKKYLDELHNESVGKNADHFLRDAFDESVSLKGKTPNANGVHTIDGKQYVSVDGHTARIQHVDSRGVPVLADKNGQSVNGNAHLVPDGRGNWTTGGLKGGAKHTVDMNIEAGYVTYSKRRGSSSSSSSSSTQESQRNSSASAQTEWDASLPLSESKATQTPVREELLEVPAEVQARLKAAGMAYAVPPYMKEIPPKTPLALEELMMTQNKSFSEIVKGRSIELAKRIERGDPDVEEAYTDMRKQLNVIADRAKLMRQAPGTGLLKIQPRDTSFLDPSNVKDKAILDRLEVQRKEAEQGLETFRMIAPKVHADAANEQARVQKLFDAEVAAVREAKRFNRQNAHLDVLDENLKWRTKLTKVLIGTTITTVTTGAITGISVVIYNAIRSNKELSGHRSESSSSEGAGIPLDAMHAPTGIPKHGHAPTPGASDPTHY
jgi:hypothetical protein